MKNTFNISMKKIFLALFCATAINAHAQQEILVSQYMFNSFILNPALAGYNKSYTVTAMNRTQWVGWQGAPVSNALTGEGGLMDGKMGVGLIVGNDRIGKTNQTDILGHYAYHLKLDNEDRLSFGARVGVSNYNNDLSSGVFWENNDNVINNSKTSVYLPKFGFGAFYESEKNHYYAGLAIPTLLDYDKHKLYSLRRHFYLHGGYNYDLNSDWLLKPSVLLKYVSGAPFQFDLNCKAVYKKTIAGALSYRFNNSVCIMAEYFANDNFRIGYGYDFTYGGIQRYSNGSHEIMAAYTLGKKTATRPKFN